MTADIKQLADIIRTEYSNLPLIAFGHSMGSALTLSHIENHGDLLKGAILCGTLGAIPGLDDKRSGGRRGSHPPAPTEPYVNLSIHTALVTLITRRWGCRSSIPSGRRTAGTVS